MHVLFLHQNFPAQFGPIAAHLAQARGHRVTFLSHATSGRIAEVDHRLYQLRGGATQNTHYASRTFENVVWNSHAAFESLRAMPEIRPDLIVAHSGFLSALPLRDLYPDVPIINYFEYFYHVRGSDIDFRPGTATEPLDLMRARFRNAALLLDLDHCDAGYSPTRWQRDRLPAVYHDKIRVIFDGIDCNIWYPRPRNQAESVAIGGLRIPAGVKVVTYVARGFEAMRGFDIFMRVAKILCERRADVVFVLAGQDRVCYGGDARLTGGLSFKNWVLAQDRYDLTRFHFVGLISAEDLARLFARSDLHVYLTAPFVLSWSLFNALACGSLVLASDTPPVRELIQHEVNGLLHDFFDVEGLADQAESMLDLPCAYQRIRENALATIRDRYALDICLPRMVDFYEDVAHRSHRGVPA